jgi:3-isopropylmalate/(R)-2-methylmalate dehydratase small subunit
MEPLTTHIGIVATLQRANVDTDAIIPKQFLKSIHRIGYGPQAFFNWRYRDDGSPNPDFELNAERFEGRSILVTGNNFGCGSSREHAVWALVQDGYRVIIAPQVEKAGEVIPGFADIFRNNAAKNGLLTIELSQAQIAAIFELVAANPGLTATVDLPRQQVTLHAPKPVVYDFEIAKGVKNQLVEGLDDIDRTLQHEADIARFEHEWLPKIAIADKTT